MAVTLKGRRLRVELRWQWPCKLEDVGLELKMEATESLSCCTAKVRIQLLKDGLYTPEICGRLESYVNAHLVFWNCRVI